MSNLPLIRPDKYQAGFKIIVPSALLASGGALVPLSDDLNRSFTVITTSTPAGTTEGLLPDTALETPKPDFSHVQAVVSLGGEVENFKCWFVIPAADYETANVPSFFTAALDENGKPRTWQQWLDTAQTFTYTELSDGRYALPGDAHGLMLGSVIAQIADECEVLNTYQVRALLPVLELTQ